MQTLTVWIVLLAAGSAHVTIHLAHDTDSEQRTRAELQQVVSKYDTGKYTFTREVVIEERAIPHSHPVLTLNTRSLGSDEQLLSSYLHEQLHWFLDAHKDATAAAVEDLRKMYPRVPVGYPDGAVDVKSTYEHLLDCWLELQADSDLLGQETARRTIREIGKDHYRWVYATLLRDEVAIGRIARAHKLVPVSN
ncbi:MAG: hypothetical protein NVS9B15_04610 [Acidobacteriaceae bacterium]